MRQPRLRDAYRKFRLSVTVLPTLEASFSAMIVASRDDVDQPGTPEHEYLREALQIIYEVSSDALAALDEMWEWIAPAAPNLDDDVDVLVADLADPDVGRAVRAVLDRAGGAAAFMTDLRRGLAERTQSYGDLLTRARVGSLAGGLRDDVEAHFGTLIDMRERERRKAQWLARFQEESDRAIEDGRVGPAGLWPWATDSEVVREACVEDPAMAAELGWFCTEVHDSALLCIIRPLVCVIVIIIVIATEGTAH